MRRRALLIVALSTAVLSQAATPDPVYAPLWLYNGNWQVAHANTAAGTKPDQLTNQCALVGKFFVCQQTVNGKPGALLIIVPTKDSGRYHTQFVGQDARGQGRGDLEISGDKWVYSSTWDQGGKTTWYRTINLFSGKNKIHFEQQESTNNHDWSTTGSGDEVRTTGVAH